MTGGLPLWSKAQWRQHILQQRGQIPAATRQNWDAAIMAAVLADPAFQEAQVVMAFHAMPEEVATLALLKHILASGKTLLLPRCRKGRPIFEPVAVTDLERDLVPGPIAHLRDPRPELPSWPKTEAIGLVLVPGLAFDQRGYRLGYGKGMYDRFLSRYAIGQTRGLAYAFQCVPELPAETYDLPVAGLCTENGLLLGC